MTRSPGRALGRPRAAALLLALVACPLLTSRAGAQLAVSSNDNKVLNLEGVNTVVRNPAPDTVTIIDLGVSPPRVVGEVFAPGSWASPPQSVAVAPDESIALVTSSTKIDPGNPARTIPDDAVTVIDLQSTPPAVLTTLRVGLGPSGVSINPAGSLALVANRSEGTVSVLAIAGKRVTPVGKVDLGEPACTPSLPVFTPDGKRAFVTRNGDHKLSVLAVNGTHVEYTRQDVSVNLRPYGIQITPKGDLAFVANIGNGPTGGMDTVTIVDIAAEPPRAIDSMNVGLIPEGIALSPDGGYLAMMVMNGSNLARSSPFFRDYALLKIMRVTGPKLTPIAESRIGHWCEGVAWSRNQRTVVVQCMNEKEIAVFGFDGRALKPQGAIKVSGGPAGMRTAERR
jgi:DNA-binding beta-propeller fold protein YncE